MVGKLAEPADVLLDGKSLSVSAEGYFAFGFEYDRTKPVRLTATTKRSGLLSNSDITPVLRKYDVQRISGLPEAYVSPPADIQKRIDRENAQIVGARGRDTAGTGFAEPLDWPVTGIVSGSFGSQRILNGEPKAPHFGVDIAAPEGTPIHAPADGVIALAEPEFYLTGGTTVLDHGHGVFTIYIHQSALKVTPAQSVKRGEIIGLVGKKGRATGPHLHWGLNWFQMKLDPSLSTRTPAPSKA
ncbi:MAG: M23 family metallopeptidase [Alphaproteobacteria bacterium]|nr:M23 family metallopeptidase [Alphaproteobacteria bacterium]